MLASRNGRDAVVGHEELAAEVEVEVVDPVHAEAVALDAGDRDADGRALDGLARGLGVGHDVARVVDRVDDVGAESGRGVCDSRPRRSAVAMPPNFALVLLPSSPTEPVPLMSQSSAKTPRWNHVADGRGVP